MSVCLGDHLRILLILSGVRIESNPQRYHQPLSLHPYREKLHQKRKPLSKSGGKGQGYKNDQQGGGGINYHHHHRLPNDF